MTTDNAVFNVAIEVQPKSPTTTDKQADQSPSPNESFHGFECVSMPTLQLRKLRIASDNSANVDMTEAQSAAAVEASCQKPQSPIPESPTAESSPTTLMSQVGRTSTSLLAHRYPIAPQDPRQRLDTSIVAPDTPVSMPKPMPSRRIVPSHAAKKIIPSASASEPSAQVASEPSAQVVTEPIDDEPRRVLRSGRTKKQ